MSHVSLRNVRKDTSIAGPSNGECPVCLESLSTERACRSSKCNHWYHCSCLQDLIKSSGNPVCAICRVPIEGALLSNTDFGKQRKRLNGIDSDIHYLVSLRIK